MIVAVFVGMKDNTYIKAPMFNRKASLATAQVRLSIELNDRKEVKQCQGNMRSRVDTASRN